MFSSHHHIICHSTDEPSRNFDAFLPQPSASASLSTASPSLQHVPSWILPPIPDFSELGLRFDNSRTSSPNATATDATAPRTTRPSLSDLHDPIEQYHPRLAATTGHTTTAQSVGSNGSRTLMKEQDSHWSLPQPGLKRNAPVAQDMVPDLVSSIFDDLQSDSNETFIVWNIPLLSSKPTQGSTDSTSSPMPSTPLTQSSILLPAHTPISSTAHSNQTSFTATAADPVKDRGSHVHAVSKPWPAEVPGKSPKSDQEQAAGTRQDAAVTTPGSGARDSSAKDRLIMAATAEKLVQKLTSEIDYTFLTDFFLIYRLFITPAALLKLFMLRFEWALLDNTPERQIVRIRTFVTLRHWLLNYFGYDFMGSRSLRQTLSAFLQSLAKHPLVVTSPRDQRIAKELRRYTQSLKKLHYRSKAQEKLERHCRGYEWSPEVISSFHGTGTASSQRSSCVSETVKRRRSIHSISATEELVVEFRSSEQSDKDNTTDESSHDDMSDLSGDSETESSADDFSFGQQSSEDDLTDPENRDLHDEDIGSDSDNGEEWEHDHGMLDDSQKPRTSSPHLTTTSPPFGSLRPQRLAHSVISSVPSRKATRGALPNYKLKEEPNHRANHHNALRQSQHGSMGVQQTVHPKTHSRPLSSTVPSVPAAVHGPPLSTRSSLRSIEPYMNPPPRSVESSEKRKTWSKYMSATVGHLSKMKRVFSSGAGKSHRHSHSPSSSIPSLGGGSRRGAASSVGQSRPSRCWQGNRSDPEGEKISHYLLGSCTGMSVLLSTSDVRRLSIDHRYASERGQQRDEAGSGWSSDDDYSQYEMTRRGSGQMSAPVDYLPEIQPHQLDPLEPQHDPQACEASWQQIPHIPYVNGSLAAFDVDIEQSLDAPAGDRRYPVAVSGEDGAKDKSAASNTTEPITDPITRPAHVLRRTPRLDQSHRESWVTFSSTGSSVFTAALNGSYPMPSQPIQERSVDHANQSVERMYSSQQQHGRQLLPHLNGHDRNVSSRRLTPVRRHSANLQCLNGWRTLSLSGEHDQSPKVQTQTPETSTFNIPNKACMTNTALSALISARPNMGARSHSHPEKTCSKSDTEMNFLSVKAAPVPRLALDSQALGRCRHWTHSRHDCCQHGSERPNGSTSGTTTPSVASPPHSRQPNNYYHHSSQFQRRATDPQLFHNQRPVALSPKKPQPPSIVLRYRSEMIAQQLCLIERDLLSKVEWYELLDAGWTKKSAPEAVPNPMTAAGRNGATANPNSLDRSTQNPATPSPAAGRHRIPGSEQDQKAKDSPGIKRLVERFNLTCQWVTSEIVSTQNIELRVKVVEKFIRIAQTCYNHSNFSSLMQLMLGLQAHSVSRLSQTWARVRSQEMNVMHDLVEFTSPFHNWKHLREAMRCIADEWGGSSSGGGKEAGTSDAKAKSTLARARKAATSRNGHVIFNKVSRVGHGKSSSGQSDSAKSRLTSSVAQELDLTSDATKTTRKQRGCIPFLGLYLSDLVFNSELPSFVEPKHGANALETQEGTSLPPRCTLINIHKHRTTATIIKRVLTFRTIAGRYPFEHEAEVQAELLSIQSLDPAEISHLSGLCEGRA
ncbi:hypothetical protein EC968_009190 [Mortierella alpina]|nr:hypothetical protein EC968_009190 [Mortierella alpina]